ncbi:MAG: outer membrane protein assembly factor BamD [Planctomycetes bacterium]|nr:outer membrane protein assembly factor BamD [Planctomycetota bacterium]
MNRVPLVGVLLMAAALAPAGLAQESFRLGDDDNWVQEAVPEPGTSAGQIARIRRALASGQHDRAEFLATEFIERNPTDPLLPEAYLARGDSLRARRDYYDALFDYEYIAQGFPGSEVFVTALERELEIAQLFAGGLRRQMWGMRILNASDEAEELLIRIQERMPGSHLAEEAGMTLADFYFARQRMDLAAEMYALFVENFPRSQRIDKARRRLIFAHLASFKGPEHDAAGLYNARTRILSLQATDPAAAQELGADALLTRIDESDAAKMLETARWYLRTGDPVAAELTVRRLVERYPRSIAARRALRAIPAILARLPVSVIAEAPDYEILRAALLGSPAPEAEVPDLLSEDAPPPALMLTTPPPGEVEP